MEEPVYTPFEFFNLPNYLQRKILIEELDLRSIDNLCKGAQIMSKEFKQKHVMRESRTNKASNFLNNLCNNAEVWRTKFNHEFPRSYHWMEDIAIKNGKYEDFKFWSTFYGSFEQNMPKYNADFLKAVQENNSEEVERLLSLGVDPNPNIRDDDENTALLWASGNGQSEIVETLLDKGADVDLQNMSGQTALIKASLGGYTKIVKMLLDKGADVDLRSYYGQTALIKASKWGHTEIVEMLLDKGADVNLSNKSGDTALIWASYFGYTEIVKMLLDKGAEVNLPNKVGYTALMSASSSRFFAVVDRLLAVGAEVNAQDEEGDTALIITMKNLDESLDEAEDIEDDPATVIDEYIPTIFTIIKYKPDPDIKNDIGETAVDIAERLGLKSVVDALLYLRRMKEGM